jgi:hypothetical protein
MIVDVLLEMRRGWGEATPGEKVHAVWALANDVLALCLLFGTLALFVTSAASAFPTGAWLSLIGLAVVWLASIVALDPVVDRVVYGRRADGTD